MQFSANRAEAIAFAESISRTWSVFLGVGDFETMEFSALGYVRGTKGWLGLGLGFSREAEL